MNFLYLAYGAVWIADILQVVHDDSWVVRNALYLAYGAVWIIHAVYLGTLVRRYSRLHQEIEELKK